MTSKGHRHYHAPLCLGADHPKRQSKAVRRANIMAKRKQVRIQYMGYR